MTQPLALAPLCAICGKPVEIEISKTDSNAEAVHEDRYAAKIAARRPPTKEEGEQPRF